jgi:uncharacterized OB-fold protein
MLIKCADCGNEISSLAPACPQCGRPNTSQAELMKESGRSTVNYAAGVIVAFLFALFALGFMARGCEHAGY